MRIIKTAAWIAIALLAAAGLGAGQGSAGQESKQAERLAKGKDLIDGICFWCHEPELIDTQRLNKAEWADLIRPMVYEGAPVTKEEFEMIVEYLAKNYGPEENGK